MDDAIPRIHVRLLDSWAIYFSFASLADSAKVKLETKLIHFSCQLLYFGYDGSNDIMISFDVTVLLVSHNLDEMTKL